MNSVAVLMSTYNGEACLRAQLDSVLQQSAPLDIYVRDDGSSDGTRALLRKYADSDSRVHVLFECNVGCTRSFMSLLKSVPSTYEYYAFCDQDDVWHRCKIERALEKLVKAGGSTAINLYCSEYNYCDQNLCNPVKSHLNRRGITFANTIFENMCSGNTMVFTSSVRQLALRGDLNMVYCHDWWLALIATCFGRVLFDDCATLEYRRTGSSVSPSGESSLALLRYRVKAFLKDGELALIKKQLIDFENTFAADMPEDKSRFLKKMVHGGVTRVVCHQRLRQKGLDELVVRFLLMLGLL